MSGASRFRFRAWDGKRNVMVANPFVDESENGEYIASEQKYFSDINEDGELLWSSYDSRSDWYECELMQSTGLTDKNGVEIFEGDETNDHVGNGVVKWCRDAAAFRVVYGDGRAKWFCDYLESERKTIEVTGNIHQNPELLVAAQ